MEPFLRRATTAGALAKPTPDGWNVEPAGRWRGRRVEVVFDHRRHDVLLHRGGMAPAIAAALTDMGWQRRGVDGQNEWWTRDRVAVTRQRVTARTTRRTQGLAIA